jgi:hypothetical protein
MDIQTITQTNIDGSTTDYVIIDRGNGEFTSMLKSTYDAQIAAQNTVPSNSSIPQAGE